MASTFDQIIQDCVAQTLSLPKSPMQTELRDLALGALNENGMIVWLKWPFDNEKMDTFQVVADASGILTMPVTVESVRMVSEVNADGTVGQPIYNADEMVAGQLGVEIPEARFLHLKDDATTGARRGKVADGAGETYSIQALSRWVDAIVDPAYSAGNPSATPTDYRVLEFPLDRAEPAVRAYLKDALRAFAGYSQSGSGAELLSMAVQREQFDNNRQRQVMPRSPMFGDVGF